MDPALQETQASPRFDAFRMEELRRQSRERHCLTGKAALIGVVVDHLDGRDGPIKAAVEGGAKGAEGQGGVPIVGDEDIGLGGVAAIGHRTGESDEAKRIVGMPVQTSAVIERRRIEKGHRHVWGQETAQPAAAQLPARQCDDHLALLQKRWSAWQCGVAREAGPVAGHHTKHVVSARGKGVGKAGHRVAQPPGLRERCELSTRREDSQTSNSSVWPKSARPTTTIPSSLTVNRARSRSGSSPITSPGGIRTPLSTMQRRSRAPLPTSTPGKSTLSRTLL